jgi:hypothetical protein
MSLLCGENTEFLPKLTCPDKTFYFILKFILKAAGRQSPPAANSTLTTNLLSVKGGL